MTGRRGRRGTEKCRWKISDDSFIMVRGNEFFHYNVFEGFLCLYRRVVTRMCLHRMIHWSSSQLRSFYYHLGEFEQCQFSPVYFFSRRSDWIPFFRNTPTDRWQLSSRCARFIQHLRFSKKNSWNSAHRIESKEDKWVVGNIARKTSSWVGRSCPLRFMFEPWSFRASVQPPGFYM